ncbi:hypothetical protein Pla22_20700 [Rubripirellula amarantea]|uniref:Uncharacterized protein n=1 Tax=Rubripirellula amarantea TaxID=2527999 RepID=A0A5C5WWR2_9BACT|nr:hypothetical protein Pla22_20700 [Rubripirellula amarantea]
MRFDREWSSVITTLVQSFARGCDQWLDVERGFASTIKVELEPAEKPLEICTEAPIPQQQRDCLAGRLSRGDDAERNTWPMITLEK